MKDAYELKRLGELYLEKGDYQSAEILFRKALNIEERISPNTVSLAQDLFNFGLVLSVLGNLREAQDYLMRAWQIERSLLGPLHPQTTETFLALKEMFHEDEDRITSDFFFVAAKPSATGSAVQH